MSKELFVSSTPHETKVAIVEDDLLAEIYFERENEYTLAGSVYKGRVTRVLPGMQSAFVDIGLERDAFLYVSDFMEQQEDDEEFERIPTQGRIESFPSEQSGTPAAEEEEELAGEELAPPASQANEQGTEQEPRRWRGRRSRRRGRDNFAPSKHERPEIAEARSEERQEQGAPERIVLPGESLAKYGQEPEAPKPAAHPPVAAVEAVQPHVPRDAAQTVEVPAQPAADWDAKQLPGESISKYRGRSEATPSAPEPARFERQERSSARRSAPERQSFSRGESARGERKRTEAPPSGPPIFALPGESLSKYRKASSETEAFQGETTFMREPEPAEEPAEREENRSSNEAPQITHSFVVEEQNERASVPAADFRAHEEESARQTSFEQERPEAPEPIGSEDNSRAGGPELTAGEEAGENAGAAGASSPEEQNVSRVFAPGQGILEEEIIEEEEIEPELLVESYEDSMYDEIEEEMMESDASEEITDAVRESHLEERTGPGFMEDDEEAAGEELEESEVAADASGEEFPESPAEENFENKEQEEEEYPDRAEVRAPAAVAGLQQRQERGGIDRNGGDRRRGRRFGRRRVAARKNIQRSSLPTISELLKEGQEILVQIAKEPIAKKGARITSHIALPGRFLVYMPTVNHVGVSRKIASEEERQRLKRILVSEKGSAHGGFIVRTAAAGANEDELRADIRFLINLWLEIKNRSESSNAPALIYHDLNLVERVLRDLVNTSFSNVWVDTEQEYERILRFLNRFQPSLLKRVKLYTKEIPLFEQFGVQEEINKALKSKVWLKSGGYIVINQTEALVAIDINTGKFVGKTARLEDTIVRTNLDAIKEIVRQIRLRDLGGIIVIDFIDMDERKNRQKVMQGLEDALRSDRAPSKVLQFNDFGLVAITRKRVKQSLERTLGTQCNYCTGTGMIKSVQTVCNEIYVEMRKMAKHLEHHDVMLRVHPEVVKGLKEKSGRWLQEMEELTGKTIIVKSDPTLHQEQFDIN